MRACIRRRSATLPSVSFHLPFALVALFATACGHGGESGRSDDGLVTPALLERAAADAGAGEPAPAIPVDAPLVVFLGDSISAGLHLAPAQAFPALVQRALAESGQPFRVVNAGVSGDTSAGGLRRIDAVLKQEPKVVVLELGGNDGLRGQAPAEIEERLGQIMSKAQSAGVQVVLLGVRLPPSLGADYVTQFEALYGRLAESHPCTFVPSFMEGAGGVAGMMLDDGIHPNAKGHARIAENVAPALAAVLADLARE